MIQTYINGCWDLPGPCVDVSRNASALNVSFIKCPCQSCRGEEA